MPAIRPRSSNRTVTVPSGTSSTTAPVPSSTAGRPRALA
ncbi:Uncharacterised protein [Mycobacteroides abscessus]|nr:Uncharacterised protein [Mycobacteroides abscessus]